MKEFKNQSTFIEVTDKKVYCLTWSVHLGTVMLKD